MKKLLSVLVLSALLLTGCQSAGSPASAEISASPVPSAESSAAAQAAKSLTSGVADASQMTTVEEVVEDWMTPIPAQDLQDGVYEIAVDSSSSMFRIQRCELRVENGQMNAALTLSGKSYLYLFPGTAEEAAAAAEDQLVTFEETAEGACCFTIPVPALDAGVPCAAFSKNKELWYDRTLLFRADSLPLSAFQEGVLTTPETLALPDGDYRVELSLGGGSGKASVVSPARLTVTEGRYTAEIVWSSKNYDYMRVGEEKLLPVNTEGNSTFLVPVMVFDRPMPVIADTVAMSEPHEISYQLFFSSESIEVLR